MKCHGRETVWGYFDPAFRPMLRRMMECEGQLLPGWSFLTTDCADFTDFFEVG
jgi:hypothetical protein